MARTLARACPSSCIRFNSLTPPSVHRSVGSRTSARVRPFRSNAKHLTPPVLKSQPVMTLSEETQRRGSATVSAPDRNRGNHRIPSYHGGTLRSTVGNGERPHRKRAEALYLHRHREKLKPFIRQCH